MVDSEKADVALWRKIDDPRREFFHCENPHQNGGNTCRHDAFEHAKGDYVYYLDDDNFLADENVLQDVHSALWGKVADTLILPAWGLFPITRLGERFYSDPPRPCHVDTLNVILRRDIAQWPKIQTPTGRMGCWFRTSWTLEYPMQPSPTFGLSPYSQKSALERWTHEKPLRKEAERIYRAPTSNQGCTS